MQLRILACLLLCAPCFARPDPPFDGYHDDESYRKAVLELSRRSDVSVVLLGQSAEGRSIEALRIAPPGAELLPTIAVLGNVDGELVAGCELALRLAELLSKAKIAEAEGVCFLVIPRPNPDANAVFFGPLKTGDGLNRRPWDDDRDGEVDEDPFADLDGDGNITWLRVRDPRGEYTLHPQDERVLVKAKRGELPRFRLLREGKDHDGDGSISEDPPGGVDFDRNFTFDYPYYENGAGPHQVSEPETRAVADFLFDHSEIFAVFCFTLEDNIHYLWKSDRKKERERILTTLLDADRGAVKRLSELYQKAVPGKGAPRPPNQRGNFLRWVYFHYGRWAFGAPGWWAPEIEEGDEKRGADELRWLAYFDNQGIDGFAPWTRVEHPDFPGETVEVGGIRPRYALNAPSDTLDALARAHVAFLQELASERPRISMAAPLVENLGGGLFRVSVDFWNRGSLPTMPEIGRRNRQFWPLIAILEHGEGTRLLTGHERSQLPPLAPDGGNARKTWLLLHRGPLPANLRVVLGSPATGTVFRRFSLR